MDDARLAAILLKGGPAAAAAAAAAALSSAGSGTSPTSSGANPFAHNLPGSRPGTGDGREFGRDGRDGRVS